MKLGKDGYPAEIKIEVPFVSMKEYAYFAARPQDPTLTSLVKKGAFYSTEVDVFELLAIDRATVPGWDEFMKMCPMIVKKFPKHGCHLRIMSLATVKYKPSVSNMIVILDVERLDDD
jgi:hypothetical protein